MRRLRDADELGQLSDLGKMLNFELKRPLTAAERTRNYRRRKRIQRAEVHSPKKRPYTAAERMQRYRERKNKAAQVVNADVLNEEWVNDANSWDGVVILPDNVPVASPLKKPFVSDAAESNNAETSTTNESVLHNFTTTKPQLVVTNAGFNSKQKTSISATVNETRIVQDITSNQLHHVQQ